MRIYYCLIFLLLCGCEDINKKEFKHLSEKQIEARIIIDKTTKSDIRSKFGGDYTLSFDENGKEKWTYLCEKQKNNPIYSIFLVHLFMSKYTDQHKLEIVFEHDVVASYMLTVTNKKTNNGLLNIF